MHARRGVVLAAALGCGAAVAAQSPGIRGFVAPERGAARALTGRYVLSIEAVKAPSARLVSFRLRVPLAYELDTDPRVVRVDAVLPGSQVLAMDLKTPTTADPADDTPLLFAQTSTSGGNLLLDVVALLKSSQKAPKHVCDVIFTSRGRPTATPLAFPAGTVAVRDADSALLGQAASFGTKPVPLFGDLDWSGAVNSLDLSLFAEAWRRSNVTHQALPLADLAPFTGPMDPNTSVSQGNGAVNAADLSALKAAWTAYNKSLITGAGEPKEGER